jgi:hypothetical protein
MERRLAAAVCAALLCGLLVAAQDAPDPELRAEALRERLRALNDTEAELQSKAQQLEEALRPENIQRSIALIGTTRPDELREQRRLQLEKERDAVQARLQEVAATRARLEAEVAQAEAEADRLRLEAATAPPEPPPARDTPPAPTPSAQPPTPRLKRPTRRQRRTRPRRPAPRPRRRT